MGDGKRRRMRYDELQAILEAGNRTEIRKVIDELTRHLADSGRMIEAGWLSLKIMAVPEDASPVQLEEMRNAFFAGAQHLFGAIMTMLDPGEDPTEADLSRMDKIKTELDQFLEQVQAQALRSIGERMTDDTTENLAYYAVPTLTQKFWRALGFRYHLGDDPPDADKLPGWMKTDMHLHFGWADRLRLLVSGRLFIASVVSTDTPSPMVCKSRMDWHILRPGEPWR